jgi:hypothetical protein
VQQTVKSWKAKEWEAVGLDAFIDTQLYMRSKQQCDDSLSEKKDVFLFQAPAQSERGIDETKSLEV